MIVYIVYAYHDYYPDPADRQIKGVFRNQDSADTLVQQVRLEDLYDHVEVDVFRVSD